MATATWVGARLESARFSCDDVQIRELTGREAISEPFVFDVLIDVPEAAGFDAKATLGLDVTIVLQVAEQEVRSIHGIVAWAEESLDADAGFLTHRLRVVPRVHRLTLSRACEVFLDLSVVDIASQLLGRAGLDSTDVDVRLTQPPAPDDFRLQYAETDLAFVSRHLERAGIAYSFDHSGGKDVLVLSDANRAFAAAAGPASIPYVGRRWGLRGVLDVRLVSEMMPTHHVVHDYNPDHPKLDLRSEHVLGGLPFGGEVVDFIAGHETPQVGQQLASIRAYSRLAQSDGFEGEANVPHVEAGHTIAVDGHPRVTSERMLVAWVEHRLTQSTPAHVFPTEDLGYSNRFRVLETDRPFRPALRTPLPRIAGVVHATIDAPPAGATDKIAQLDEQGRYTVHFLFDKADATKRPRSSARVRMMQPHSGPSYGMHFPLKPNVEVLVAFIEGDPDRPVIVGSVPHPLTTSPVTRENARMNNIRTESGIRIEMKDA